MVKDDDEFLGSGIDIPHDHDVLSGRGNFVNYHPGNEHFRALVRKHKVAYVACPKPQKGHFSKLIYNEIKSRNPPGRFLKQKPSTKQWYDIGEKKALDKTRQALREGAPDIQKELTSDEIAGDFRGSSTNACVGNDMRGAAPQLSASNGAHTVPMNCLTPSHLTMQYHENSGATFNPFPSQNPNFMMVPPNSTAHLHQAQSMVHQPTDQQRAYFPPQVLQSMFQQQDPSQSRISYQQQQQQPHQQSCQHSSDPVYQPNPLRESAQVPSSFHNTLNNTAGDNNLRHDKFFPVGRHPSDPSHADIRGGQHLGRPQPASRSTSTEECEHIAPLYSEVNMFSFGRSRRADMQDLHCNSISSLGVDGVFHPDKQSAKSKQSSNSTSNQQSFQMSLSDDGFQQSELDPNFLSGAFNSSLKIGGSSSKNSSTKIGLQNSAMEMSMNTIGEFGDSSMIKMTDSQADMSFANVFDDSNVTSRE